MLSEITPRDIKMTVDGRFPALSGWLQGDATEALYHALWVGSIAYVDGRAPALAGQLETVPEQPPAVVTLARLFGLVSAAYLDAWLECHVSGASGETAELPPPPGWELLTG